MPYRQIKRTKFSSQFVLLEEKILASPAYRDLKPAERCLLTEFQRIFRPWRNGQLSISVVNAAQLIHVNKDTASTAFWSLAAHGFIALTRGEYWQERLAREWRLTFECCNGREPTNDWRRWKPGQPVVTLPNKSRSQIKGQPRPNPRVRLSEHKGQGLISKEFRACLDKEKQ